MSLALFDDPIRGTSSVQGSAGEILVLGLYVDAPSNVFVVALNGDGEFDVIHTTWVTTDWRYDPERDSWVDETARRALETTQLGPETDQLG